MLSGHEAVAELLVTFNTNVFSGDLVGATLLHYAAENGNHAILKLLLAKNGAIDIKDNYQERILHLAAREGS